MRIAHFAAMLVLLTAACGSDDEPDTCLPLGAVSVGAIGTVGPPLVDYADCYPGAMPVVSLDGDRTATVTESGITFDVAGIDAIVDANCRLTITYTFDTMLADNTPAVGTSSFAADPDPDNSGNWALDPVGSTIFEWDDGVDTAVCGNVVNDAFVVVRAR